MRTLVTAAQVAKALGYTYGWFASHRARLEAEHNFPRPVDGCGLRWDPRAIEAWQDARLPAPIRSAEAAAEAELIRRAHASSAPRSPP
jgi:predicted DNA-binding transcriptional regulator AlpA